jgi:hypothetical protein
VYNLFNHWKHFQPGAIMNTPASGKPALRQALTWGMMCALLSLLMLAIWAAPRIAQADGGGFPTPTLTLTPIPTNTPLPTFTPLPPTSYPDVAPQVQQPALILPSPTPTPTPTRGPNLALICLPLALGVILVVIIVATIVARRQR